MSARKRRRKLPKDVDSEDEPYCADGESVPAVYAPAYRFGGGRRERFPIGASHVCHEATGGGPQCSEHPGDFCFFCAYEKDPNAEAGSAADLYGSLTDLVRSMERQRKEFPAIVDAVSAAYEGQIRPHVHDPEFGAAPEWSPASIERHLTFSSQFEGVFDNAVTQVFHALIDKQNNTVVDGVTGHVIEERRVALMSTLDHYMKWQRSLRMTAKK